MIKSFEELGEILAEFENRLSYLENSQPYKLDPEKPDPVEVKHLHIYDHIKREDVSTVRIVG